ncbi:MAG: alpha/beta hydrolase [bacterium]|nr:alpha/beta hydrolase [bacterium]
MKRVYIIHGWASHPNDAWIPWLKRSLEDQGFTVMVPLMPHADVPVIAEWVGALSALVGQADEEVYFIGHSIGCQAIMRYLETLPDGVRIGGCVFVAGWVTLTLDDFNAQEIAVAKPWLETPINAPRVRSRVKSITAIFSDNDKFVPLTDATLFEEQLGAKIIIEPEKGHFASEDGIFEVPVVLEAVAESLS